tara:strand:- start:1941 stop:2099 length:159 start_codon:yes stop_codon:yes gene_type:complete
VSKSKGRGNLGPANRLPIDENRAFATALSALSVMEETGEAYEVDGILEIGVV